MEIDQKIKEVKEYFSKRIVDRDFELTHVGEYIATIHFGGEYFLEIWIANNLNRLEPYWHFDASKVLSIFPDQFSEEEQKVLHEVISNHMNRLSTMKKLNEKRLQIRKLKEEVEKMEQVYNDTQKS
jgi:hypothetical protein